MADDDDEQKQKLLLEEQLEKVQKGYGNYAEVLHNGSYTTWAEVGAAERDDLTDLRIPKDPVGNILKAAKSGLHSQCFSSASTDLLPFMQDFHKYLQTSSTSSMPGLCTHFSYACCLSPHFIPLPPSSYFHPSYKRL